MNLRGKTVYKVHSDDGPDGGPVTLVEFNDGTALWVEAYGREDVYQQIDLVDSHEVAGYLAKLRLRRMKREARQAEIDAFNALPDDEKNRIRAEKRAAMGPLARVWEDMVADTCRSIASDLNRAAYFQAPTKPRKARRS